MVNKRLVELTVDALESRGWSRAEAEQIVKRLTGEEIDDFTDFIPTVIIVPFGKHKGMTVRQVFDIDRDYIYWLSSQGWLQAKFPLVYTEIMSLLTAVKGK